MRLVLILFVCALVRAQSPVLPGCQPDEPVRAAIAEAQQVRSSGRTAFEVLADRSGRLHQLAARFPGDFFVRKAYLDEFAILGRAPDEAVEEYTRRLAEAPGDPAVRYLHALALVGRDTPQAIRELDRLAAAHPGFAWPFATLADIYGYPAFRDVAKFQSNARTFHTLCQASLDAYPILSGLPDSPFLQGAAVRFRGLLTGRTDDAAIAQWPALWRLEFKITPVERQAALRKQVERDLAALAPLDPGRHAQLTAALEEGYQITGNQQGIQAALARDPSPDSAIARVLNAASEWAKSHPEPKDDDPDEARTAYWEARLQALVEWRKLSADPFFMLDRARALAESSRRSARETLAAVDEYRAMEKATPSGVHLGFPTVEMMIAQAYVKRGVRLEEVPALIHAALDDLAGRRQPDTSDLWSSDRRDDMRALSYWFLNKNTRGLLLDACIGRKDFAGARELLVQLDSDLAAWRTRVTAWQREKDALPKDRSYNPMLLSAIQSLPQDEAVYRELRARLAKAEGRWQDALGFYQTGAVLARIAQDKDLQRKLTAAAREMWVQRGGSGESWQDWLQQLPAAANAGSSDLRTWTRAERPLPEFTVTDIRGRTWKKSDLAGKTTLVNLWSTWCGPCREELPRLQHLYERLRGRDDVQLITLSLNDSIGEVEPFVDQNHYTFPVLLARDMVDRFLGNWGLPQTWVVDRTGVLRLEQTGFLNAPEEEWIAQAMAQLDAVRLAAGRQGQ